MIQDAKNLLEATISDIEVTAYFFKINSKYNITAEDYIKSSMVIVIRNNYYVCMMYHIMMLMELSHEKL